MATTLVFAGDRVKQLREAMGLSRAEFAAVVGVTRQMLWSWEIGRSAPHADVLARVAQATGARIDTFFMRRTDTNKAVKPRRGAVIPA